MALRILRGHFDDAKPRRYISGCCVSSTRANTNGRAYVARGALVHLPLPLLLDHAWVRPLGKVVRVHAIGDLLVFAAEFVNDDALDWAAEAWQKISAQELTRTSVESLSLDPVVDYIRRRWVLNEISLVPSGADKGAILEKTWSTL